MELFEQYQWTPSAAGGAPQRAFSGARYIKEDEIAEIPRLDADSIHHQAVFPHNKAQMIRTKCLLYRTDEFFCGTKIYIGYGNWSPFRRESVIDRPNCGIWNHFAIIFCFGFSQTVHLIYIPITDFIGRIEIPKICKTNPKPIAKATAIIKADVYLFRNIITFLTTTYNTEGVSWIKIMYVWKVNYFYKRFIAWILQSSW